MKPASIKEIKDELKHKSNAELIELCLSLSKFKKDSKELISYLLFESENEELFIQKVKEEVDVMFSEMNCDSYFYMKKTIRKILRYIKKNNRYSKKKETEVELLIYFCEKMNTLTPSIDRSQVLMNIFDRERASISKKIKLLHPDLQYDYKLMMEEI